MSPDPVAQMSASFSGVCGSLRTLKEADKASSVLQDLEESWQDLDICYEPKK